MARAADDVRFQRSPDFATEGAVAGIGEPDNLGDELARNLRRDRYQLFPVCCGHTRLFG